MKYISHINGGIPTHLYDVDTLPTYTHFTEHFKRELSIK